MKNGDLVRFYDSQMANRDKDHSGTNQKYYPMGTVLRVYYKKNRFGWVDKLCDILVGDRVSKAHFVSSVELLN